MGPVIDFLMSITSGTDTPGLISQTTAVVVAFGLLATAYLLAAALVAHWSGVVGIRVALVALAALFGSFLFTRVFSLIVFFVAPDPVGQVLGSDRYLFLLLYVYSAVHMGVTALLSRLPALSGTHLTGASSRTPGALD